jgi:hypothetical protein
MRREYRGYAGGARRGSSENAGLRSMAMNEIGLKLFEQLNYFSQRFDIFQRGEGLHEIGEDERFHSEMTRGFGEKTFLAGREAEPKIVSKAAEELEQVCLRAAHFRASNQIQDMHRISGCVRCGLAFENAPGFGSGAIPAQ